MSSSTFCGSLVEWMQSVSEAYNSHPLSVNSVFTVLFTTASTTALILEANQHCNPDLQLWLGVMTVYGFVRWILRLLLEAISLEYISHAGNVTVVYKIIEMVDIFGMVWFSVGNLLVFNGTKCSQPDFTPMTFWICLIYIIVGYMSLILPMAVRMCIINSQQIFPNERLPDEAFNGPESFASVQVRNEMWKRWLAGYGCSPVTYGTLKVDAVRAFESNETHDSPSDEGHAALTPIIANCPICLQDFEDDSELLNYPCKARIHYFHSACMYDWLKVASRRGFDNITCPCCREGPSMPGGQRRRSFGRHASVGPEEQRSSSTVAGNTPLQQTLMSLLPTNPTAVHPSARMQQRNEQEPPRR